jgi:putative SOS response-associated peptidase YedK
MRSAKSRIESRILRSDSLYEWKAVNGAKQPYYYSRADSGVLSIAGLWDQWRDRETREPLLSCTMIVRAANEIASRVHDRIPVFLAEDNFASWLGGSAGAELLHPAPENLFQVWPVSKRVNHSADDNNDPALIERIALS